MPANRRENREISGVRVSYGYGEITRGIVEMVDKDLKLKLGVWSSNLVGLTKEVRSHD
jgi:hypothetical protein